MVNLVGVLLRFCRPFVVGYLEGGGAAGGKFGDLFERHLDPGYYRAQGQRLGQLAGAACLGGEGTACQGAEGSVGGGT